MRCPIMTLHFFSPLSYPNPRRVHGAGGCCRVIYGLPGASAALGSRESRPPGAQTPKCGRWVPHFGCGVSWGKSRWMDRDASEGHGYKGTG